MGRVYSTCFVSQHDTPTETVLEYEFPPGFTYVVREIGCFCSNATGLASAQAYDENNATFWHDQNSGVEIGVFILYQGRQVFDKPGGKLFLAFNAVSVLPAVADWRVSGYRLSP